MSKKIESHLIEDRIFKPSKEFSKKARVSSMSQYRRMYKESIEKPSIFWAREARELHWQKRWNKVLDWKAPFAKWFTGAKRPCPLARGRGYVENPILQTSSKRTG